MTCILVVVTVTEEVSPKHSLAWEALAAMQVAVKIRNVVARISMLLFLSLCTLRDIWNLWKAKLNKDSEGQGTRVL